MVRSVTFEIRWHDTQPIYSCPFSLCLPTISGVSSTTTWAKLLVSLRAKDCPSSNHPPLLLLRPTSAPVASSSKSTLPPVMAGGQSWRLATAGGDNNARIWMVHPNIPSPAAMASAAASRAPPSSHRMLLASNTSPRSKGIQA